MARLLNDIVNDKTLIVYITFLYNIIIKVNVISGLFQYENANIFEIYDDLYKLLLSNLRLIIKPIFLENIHEIKSRNFKKINDILNNEFSYIPIDLLDFGFGY